MKVRSKGVALERAVRLLGKNATVMVSTCGRLKSQAKGHVGEMYCHDHNGYDCDGTRKVYKIGVIRLGLFNAIVGTGDSWQEALDAAEAKVKRDGGVL